MVRLEEKLKGCEDVIGLRMLFSIPDEIDEARRLPGANESSCTAADLAEANKSAVAVEFRKFVMPVLEEDEFVFSGVTWRLGGTVAVGVDWAETFSG